MTPVVAAMALLGAAQALSPPASDYARGVSARLAGDPVQAIALLQRAVASAPQDADAHLELGLALLAAGRLDEAGRELRETLAIAPGYRDATLALARIEQRRRADASARARWQLDVDGSYSNLNGDAPDWADFGARLTRRLNGGPSLSAAFERSRRFGKSDSYGELRVDGKLSPSASFWLLAGGTPNADFRPGWQVGAGGALRVRGGPEATVLTIETREAHYASSGTVQILNPGIEQYVGGGSWLTARIVNIFDGRRHEAGWLARGDWMVSPRTRLFGGAGNAPDLSEGVVARVSSVFGGISAEVSDRTTLRLSLARESRAGPSKRFELSAGLGYRF